MNLAAIDIGSNAARLLITSVDIDNLGKPVFNKLNLIRIPLRLGFDVFENKVISPQKEEMMIETMMSFKHLMSAYNVKEYKAYATSAMRDATNSQEIIAKIKEKAKLNIEIITGETEANLIFENHFAENLPKENSYLYIDVGGGSTELSFFNNGEFVSQKSFNIGTIRLLKNNAKDIDWDEMKLFVKNVIKVKGKVMAIGSGGNINKIFSLSKRKDGKPLPIALLRDYYKELESVTIDERISKYGLRSDRADVIVPALSIYINVMRWADAEEILVPKIGMADGLIKHLWNEISSK
ncbi:MAG: exopolyphosphatase [Ferruginibacter sp.]